MPLRAHERGVLDVALSHQLVGTLVRDARMRMPSRSTSAIERIGRRAGTKVRRRDLEVGGRERDLVGALRLGRPGKPRPTRRLHAVGPACGRVGTCWNSTGGTPRRRRARARPVEGHAAGVRRPAEPGVTSRKFW